MAWCVHPVWCFWCGQPDRWSVVLLRWWGHWGDCFPWNLVYPYPSALAANWLWCVPGLPDVSGLRHLQCMCSASPKPQVPHWHQMLAAPMLEDCQKGTIGCFLLCLAFPSFSHGLWFSLFSADSFQLHIGLHMVLRFNSYLSSTLILVCRALIVAYVRPAR